MTAPPGYLADRPALEDAALGLGADSQPHDLLSELLRSVRLSGERIVAYAPPRTFSIGFADIGSLHIVEAGELVLRIDGDPTAKHISRGDVVLLPRGDTHHISDAGRHAQAIMRAGAADNKAPEPARWLCGTFTIGDPQASHLLGSLPAAIILRGDRGPALEGLEVARRMLLFEMQSPSQGSAVMGARLFDLIFFPNFRPLGPGPGPRADRFARAPGPRT